MSNYHVLQSEPGEQGWAKVAFHIQLPDEANFAGVNLRDAVKEYLSIEAGKKMGFQYTEVPWLEDDFPAEYQDIQDGLVVERVEKVAIDPALTLPEKRDVLDARFAQLSISVIAHIRNAFEFWGYDRDIP